MEEFAGRAPLLLFRIYQKKSWDEHHQGLAGGSFAAFASSKIDMFCCDMLLPVAVC